MLLSVQLGHYSGIIAGALVDALPNIISYRIAAVLSAISYGGLAYTIQSDFEFGMQMLTCLLLFMAGLGASISTVVSIVTNVKNYDDEVSTLLVAIMVTYMKLATNFDIALKEGFFPEADDSTYLIIIGVATTLICVAGMFTMKKVDLGSILESVSKTTDPTGVLIFIATLGVYLLTYWVVVQFLNIYVVGVPIVLFFLFLNFLMLGLSIFLVYKAVKSGKGVGLSSVTGALSKKK